MSTFGILGLSITPPLLGRISIGNVVEKNGKRLPVKDDQITITTQFQVQRKWIKHPLDESLRVAELAKKQGKEVNDPSINAVELMNTKLRSIPVKMLFNDPNLNLRAEHTCFEKNGRPLCKGNGKEARRHDAATGEVKDVACNPSSCEIGKQYHCKPYTRLNLQIEGQEDELGSFMYRTAGWNSLKTLQAKLNYFYGLSNGKLAGLPLELVMRGKSTAQSMGTTFFYLDLVLRSGYTMAKAVKQARDEQLEWEEAGISRDAFEEMARQGIANGMFEDSPDEISSVLEEFFPEVSDDEAPAAETSVDSMRQLLDQENADLGITAGSTEASDASILAQLDTPELEAVES